MFLTNVSTQIRSWCHMTFMSVLQPGAAAPRRNLRTPPTSGRESAPFRSLMMKYDEESCYTIKRFLRRRRRPTCQVGFRQGTDLRVGSGGKDLRQGVFCGSPPLLVTECESGEKSDNLHMWTKALSFKRVVPNIPPHLDGSDDFMTVVDGRRFHQSD